MEKIINTIKTMCIGKRNKKTNRNGFYSSFPLSPPCETVDYRYNSLNSIGYGVIVDLKTDLDFENI